VTFYQDNYKVTLSQDIHAPPASQHHQNTEQAKKSAEFERQPGHQAETVSLGR